MKLIKTLAQVILVTILTFIITWFCTCISTKDGDDFLLSMLGGIPIFDMWLSMLANYLTFDFSNIFTIYLQCFFEAIIMGFCMNICQKIDDFLNKTGLFPNRKVLVTFIGLIVGFFFCNIVGHAEGISVVVVGLIIIYGILMMIRPVLPFINLISINDFLIIFINGIVSIILTGYIASIYLLKNGAISISNFINIFVITIAALGILFTIDGIADALKRK